MTQNILKIVTIRKDAVSTSEVILTKFWAGCRTDNWN